MGWRSNRVLFSNNRVPEFGAYDGWKKDEGEDQYFTLAPGKGVHEGKYLIKSKITNKVLCARYDIDNPVNGVHDSIVWHIEEYESNEDNWFWIEPGTGQHANRFRLITSGLDNILIGIPMSLAVASYADGTLKSESSGLRSGEQWFSFLFEDMEFDRISYHPENGHKDHERLEVLDTLTYTNDTGSKQQAEFGFEYSKSDNSTFEHGYGLSLKVGAKFKTGIPIILEGEISTELTTSINMKWGSSTTEGTRITVKHPETVRPYQKMVATCAVKRATIEVPYTMVMRSADTGKTVESTGVYKGVSSWDLQYYAKETSL